MVPAVVETGDSLERIPFSPGRSPFHIKGVVYRGLVDHLDRQVPGGLDAVLRRIEVPELRDFFQQPFMAASWYDVFPFPALISAASRAVGRNFVDFNRARARAQADNDIRGVYKNMFRFASAEGLAARVPRIVALYSDFVSMDARLCHARAVELSAANIPLFLLPWYVDATEAYVESALESFGARLPRVKARPPVRDGNCKGSETVRLKFDIAWS